MAKPKPDDKPASKPGHIRVANGALPIEVRQDSFNEESRTVEVVWAAGAAVKRYNWDDGYYMEVLRMEASAVDLGRMNAGASFLDTHEQYSMASRLGAVVPGTARIEGGKGICTVQISRNPEGERIMMDLRDHMPLNISVGYKTHAYEKTEGDENNLPIYTATRWEPMEISAVPVPADPGAQARADFARKDNPPADVHHVPVTNSGTAGSTAASAARNEETHMTPEEIAAAAAAEKKRTDDAVAAALAERDAQDEAKRVAAAAEAEAARNNTDNTQNRNNQPVLTQAQVDDASRAAVASERTRTSDISLFGAQHRIPEAVTRKALAEGHSMDQYRQAAFDALLAAQSRNETFSVAPQFRGVDTLEETQTRRDAIAGAILHRSMPSKFKLEDKSKDYAHMRLMDVAKELLTLSGVNVRGMSPNEIASRAFHTSSDFGVIMEQVVKRTVNESYRAAAQQWRPLGNQTTAPDFKGMQSLVVGEFGDLQKVNEHGEFKRTTFTFSGQTWSIATYGLIFGVTRQALINDQIDLFASIPRKFTNSVLRTESNIVWDIYLKNPKMSDGKALFHADHGNLAASGSELSIASLSAARLAMTKQRDFEGKSDFPVVPRYLIVPPELEYKATQILFGVPSPTAIGDTIPEYVRSLKLIVEPKLSQVSTTAWYLQADPAETDTFDYAYLEGENGPYTEQRVGFDIDGTEYKIRLDFGAAAQDYRGFYKNNGAAPA